VTSPFHSIIDTATGLPCQGTPHEAGASAASATGLGDRNPIGGNQQEAVGHDFDLHGLFKVDPPDNSRPLAGPRPPLSGSIYTPEEALTLLNSHFFIGKSSQETAIFRINDDGSAAFLPNEQFKLEIQNIFVELPGKPAKIVPAEKYWKESPDRHEKTIVFEPKGTNNPRVFNLWRGYGVEPQKTRQQLSPLLRHIWEVICRKDREKLRYLIRWLAWAIQNPDKHPGTVIVLKSRKQGTGKSTLGAVMLKIFGVHGAQIDDSNRLLGQFNDWIEPVSFILAEEILWAGDHKTTDKLKSRITSDTIQIERKHGGIHQITNRLHVLMTTNHDHAVGAGVGDRRFVVFDVSDHVANNKAWFDRIYGDMNGGGAGEFLDYLQKLALGNWHPRQILKTAETVEQQRMSGDSISQWAQACIEADAIIGDWQGDLRRWSASKHLREAYHGYCKQRGVRPVNDEVFGKACTEMFGSRRRNQAETSSAAAQTGAGAAVGITSRPWGYDVPDANTWQGKIDERLGIKN
jgi:Family of unknown function (DUF5906)